MFATASSSLTWGVSLTTQEATDLSGAPVSPDGRAFAKRTALRTLLPRANLNPDAPTTSHDKNKLNYGDNLEVRLLAGVEIRVPPETTSHHAKALNPEGRGFHPRQ
jgi:hypothetical protein